MDFALKPKDANNSRFTHLTMLLHSKKQLLNKVISNVDLVAFSPCFSMNRCLIFIIFLFDTNALLTLSLTTL